MVFIAELQRLRQDMESVTERAERQRESLREKMMVMDKDHQMALQQAKHSHEEDITRLIDSKVNCT